MTTEVVPSGSKIDYAKLSPAPVEEVRGGWLYRNFTALVTAPWHFTNAVLGTLQMRRTPDPLKWTSPMPLTWYNWAKWRSGYGDQYEFMQEIPHLLPLLLWVGEIKKAGWHEKWSTAWNAMPPSFWGTLYQVTKQQKVAQAIISPHRNSDHFQPSLTFQKLFELLEKIFPATFDSPDRKMRRRNFIATCFPEDTESFRKLFHSCLSPNKVKEYQGIMQAETERTLLDWAEISREGKPLNVTKESQYFASRLITKLLLGSQCLEEQEKIADAITTINAYSQKNLQGMLTPEEKQIVDVKTEAFRQAIEEILSNPNIPLFGEDSTFDLDKKRATVYFFFFAGQETIAAAIAHGFEKIARDQPLQEQLYEKIKAVQEELQKEPAAPVRCIEWLWQRVVWEFPPAAGLGRTLNTRASLAEKPPSSANFIENFEGDLRLQYRYEDEARMQEIFFPAGSNLAVNLQSLTREFEIPAQPPADDEPLHRERISILFGAGKHHCAGDNFARQEFCTLFTQAISGYCITTEDQELNPPVVGITMRKTRDVKVFFTPR